MRLWLVLLVFWFGASQAQARNQLATETSPYLQLHATDPVNWQAWNAETLAAAKAAGKPILLSIGYLACHWCHVMQEESYTNDTIAAVINTHFTPVLIDREERPDLDHTFQHAALVMDLPTGWPLTLFLTPAGQPFWGGTYFPATPRGGMSGFGDIVKSVAEAFAEDPVGIAKDATRVTLAVRALSSPQTGTITPDTLNNVAETLLGGIDAFSGGFGDAAKFPQTPAQHALWHAYLRTGDERYREAVVTSLHHMLHGGLVDHVGGGFFRYTVDPLWHTPHFEKMLDTNGAMIRLITAVWRGTRAPLLKRRVEQTIAFLGNELRLEDGAFATALDADSVGADGRAEEGAYYVWNRADLHRLVGSKTEDFFSLFALAPTEGNDAPDPGILYRQPETDSGSIPESTVEKWLTTIKHARAKRPRPRRDEKVLADWNGLTIRALAEAGVTFDQPVWIDMARSAFDAVTKRLEVAQRLQHSAVDSRTTGPATASDLGAMINAALSLFEATGQHRYRVLAQQWAENAMRFHWDAEMKGFFESARDSGPVPVRTKIFTDTPNTGGNSALIEALARLYYLSGEMKWQRTVETVLSTFAGVISEPYPGVAGFANGAETMRAALQIVIVGDRGAHDAQALMRTAYQTPVGPFVIQVPKPGETLPDGHPAQYKTQIEAQATAYVCKGSVCSLPVITQDELKQTLETMRRAR